MSEIARLAVGISFKTSHSFHFLFSILLRGGKDVTTRKTGRFMMETPFATQVLDLRAGKFVEKKFLEAPSARSRTLKNVTRERIRGKLFTYL